MDAETWLNSYIKLEDTSILNGNDININLDRLLDYMEDYVLHKFKEMKVSRICDKCNKDYYPTLNHNGEGNELVSTFMSCPNCRKTDHLWIRIKI